jgi:hypothetical protein
MAAIDYKLVSDFTGGINFRADQFQLAPNESPEILNCEIDPRGGVFSRAGYQTKHPTAVVTGGAPWKPKGLFNYQYANAPRIMLTTGYETLVSSDGGIYHSTGGNFTRLSVDAFNFVNVKSTNGASMTQWEDTMYFAVGVTSSYMYSWTAGDAFATQLTASGPTWQPYEIPAVTPYMPRAEHVLAHANKLFVANTYEDGAAYPNRLRWSHENLPGSWYQQDYIDIIAGGEGIRGIQVVDGQLLIFKPKAIYLLMGYDADSFQLVELTTVLGIDYPQQATAGASGVFFFDYPNGLFFYDRNGIQDIFERIKPIIINGEVNSSYTFNITLSYVHDRLWISMPYASQLVSIPPSYPSVNFIFDPSIGQRGAYTMFQTAEWFNPLTAAPDEAFIAGYGLVCGMDWRDANDNPYYLMTSPDENFAYVMYVDDYNNTLDDSPPTFTGKFETIYRTSWFDDNRYIQLKTFIRPYFVLKEVATPTQIRLNVYKDYDETTQDGGTRTISLSPISIGGSYSTTGSGGVYGTATYGVNTVGAQIKRRGIAPLGRGFSVQLEFVGPDDLTDTDIAPGRKWGLNSIGYKFKRRKIRGT